MAMETYTFGSHDFMMAVLEKANREMPYPIQLNRTDFRVFITILQRLALYGKVTHKDIETIPGYGTVRNDDSGDDEEWDPIEHWAMSWLSGIAETLGVEGI